MLAVQNLSRLDLKQEVMLRTLDAKNDMKFFGKLPINKNTTELISERTLLYFKEYSKSYQTTETLFLQKCFTICNVIT